MPSNRAIATIARAAVALMLAVRPLPARESQEPPVIESIEIRVLDVFDDDRGGSPEDWPYRVANQLHIDTKEGIIEQELLFREGDTLDEESLAQTERNLRALPFLREARVETTPSSPGRVRVRVYAYDSWSTQPEARLAKVGNVWTWGVGATETNLLGRGKTLQGMYSSGLDRDETFVFYRDPRLVGSRVALSTLLSSASDGHAVSVGAVRPFYSLETAWSFRASFEDFERLDPLYLDGEEISDLLHTRSRFEAELARAVVRRSSRALRVHVGYRYSDDLVEADRRQFGILQVGLTSVSHSFLELTHVNRFERTEDVNLGNEAAAFVGMSSEALGGEPGRSLFFFLSERRGVPVSAGGFLLGTASFQARNRNDALENSIAHFRLDFVQKLSARRLVLAKADYYHGSSLDPEVQLRLGAESGLRGYPVRQFNGDRSLLLSAEGRWFLADDVLRLVSMGVACFFDSGYAWPEGAPLAMKDLRSDVGMSLLLGANRVSVSRPAIRIDLAYALDPIPGRSRWLLSAGSRVGF